MTIAYDAESSHPTGGTGELSWSHVPTGTPKAIFVRLYQFANSTDQVTGVTYGGVTMTRVDDAFNTTGEAFAVYLYFLGSSIPTGTQTIVVSVNATGSTKQAVADSWTAATNTEIIDFGAEIAESSDGPSIALEFGGRTCAVMLFGISGEDTVDQTAGASGWTYSEADAGTTIMITARYNTIGSTDVTATWTQSANDIAAIAAAFSEVTGSKTITASGSSYTLTGTELSLEYGRLISIASGTITLSGSELALTLTSAGWLRHRRV